MPIEWTQRRLRFDVRLNPLKSELQLSDDTEVSFVPMDAVGELGGLRLEEERAIDEVYNGYTYFRDGDVVVSKITPCFENGKGALAIGLANGVGFGTTELHVMRPRETLHAGFLFYISIAHDFRCYGTAEMLGAGGQKRVPERFLKDWRAPLPPFETQKRIAAFLDEKTARIDALIARKRQLLERLAEKRQAIITQAVTKGLNPDAPMKDSGIDWLGQIPAHWKVVSLKRLVRMKSGDALTSSEIEEVGPYPVYGGNGFRGFTETYNTEGELIIIGRQGEHCGNIHRITGQTFVTEHSLRCFPEKPLNPKWLAALLELMKLREYSVSAAQPGLSADRLGMLPTIHCPPEDQDAIAIKLEDEFERMGLVSTPIDISLARLSEYRSALITSAVTGQIEYLQ